MYESYLSPCPKIQIFPFFLKSSILLGSLLLFLTLLSFFCFNYLVVALPWNFKIFNNLFSNVFLTGFSIVFISCIPSTLIYYQIYSFFHYEKYSNFLLCIRGICYFVYTFQLNMLSNLFSFYEKKKKIPVLFLGVLFVILYDLSIGIWFSVVSSVYPSYQNQIWVTKFTSSNFSVKKNNLIFSC